jgi:SAM-dependent methyltransferase
MFNPTDIIPGFKELHSRRGSHRMKASYQPHNEIKPLKYNGFRGDARTFSMMLDFFYESNIEGKWDRHLDIGGAEGYHASLFKAHGLTEVSDTIDVQRYENDRRKRQKFYRRFVFETQLQRLRGAELGSGKFGLRFGPGSRHFRYPFFGRPFPDDMQVGDLYSLDSQYDLISAFLCLEYFDLEKVIAKISDLLSENGLFCFIVNYWWYPVNSTGIVGGVPYAAQQFTLDELKLHFETHFPDELPYLEESYRYFHKGRRPILDDYIDICDRHDLKVISAKRIIPSLADAPRTPWTPLQMQGFEETQLRRVLDSIHRFDPRVSLLDLETGWVMAAFRKMKPRTGAPEL